MSTSLVNALSPIMVVMSVDEILMEKFFDVNPHVNLVHFIFAKIQLCMIEFMTVHVILNQWLDFQL